MPQTFDLHGFVAIAQKHKSPIRQAERVQKDVVKPALTNSNSKSKSEKVNKVKKCFNLVIKC